MDGFGEINGYLSWQKAGFDRNFTLFKIYTRTILDSKTGESGVFEFSCQHPLAALEQQADPVGFLKQWVRLYIVQAVTKTTVPINLWIVEFSPIMEQYHLPSHLYLDTTRDRTWLA